MSLEFEATFSIEILLVQEEVPEKLIRVFNNLTRLGGQSVDLRLAEK